MQSLKANIAVHLTCERNAMIGKEHVISCSGPP